MSELWRRLRVLFHREQFVSELEEEMRVHLEMREEEDRENGAGADEARRNVRQQFGNPTLLRERSRDAWGTQLLDGMWQDLRYAGRSLWQRPGFAVVAILSLALGVGVNTAIFSFINGALLRPLPVPDADRLVSVYHRSTEGYLSSSSYPDFKFYRDHNDVFSGMVAYLRLPVLVFGDTAEEKVPSELVNEEYFTVLGLQPALGRWFGDNENEPLVVLSYDRWQRNFGADPGVIGKSLRIGTGVFTVAGVAPRGFRGLVLDWGDLPELWIPIGTYREAVPALSHIDVLNHWGMHSFLLAGKLKREVSFDRARAALAVLSERATSYRESALHDGFRFVVELYPAEQARFWPDSRHSVTQFLSLLAVGVGLILLIACLNLANLLLARLSQRNREMAVRLSIGCGRTRLIRQFVMEGLLLSLAGGVAGLLVARWTVAYLSSFSRPFNMPLTIDASLDLRVLGFALGLSIATGVILGLIPASQATRVNLSSALKQQLIAPGARVHGLTLRDGLVIAQIALSVVLLVGAGLFLITVRNARAEDLSPDPGNVLVGQMDPTLKGYDDQQRLALYEQVLDRIKVLPGVRAAAFAFLVPLGGMRGGTDVVVEGKKRIQVDFNVVSPEYVDTGGLALVRGRGLTEHDRSGAPPVALVNEIMAQRFWPGEDPIGKRFRLTWKDGGEVEVAGVVRDGKFRNFRDQHRTCFYLAVMQHPPRSASSEVRTSGNPMMLISAIREAARAVDPAVPITDILTLESIRERGMSQELLIRSMLTGLGVVALVLAVIGVYGVMSFVVAGRTREFGIRMALGATARNVAEKVIERSATLAVAGLSLGFVVSIALSRYVASLLYGVRPTDPWIFGGVSLMLLAVAVLAAWWPARRASRVNPIEALRHE